MELSEAEKRDLHRLVGMMIPPSAAHDLPGADDPAIFADILASIGRDHAAVKAALATLAQRAGGAFADLPAEHAAPLMHACLDERSPEAIALGRVVLQCYYRDDRVLTSVGHEPRPPFPKGHVVEQGDWSLLDPVRRRPPFWRDDRVA
jgi:hypothetical protein